MSGRCTCAGAGDCWWCRGRLATEEEIAVAEELAYHRGRASADALIVDMGKQMEAHIRRFEGEMVSLRAVSYPATATWKVGDRVRLIPAKFPRGAKGGPPLVIDSVTMVEHVMVHVEGGDESWPQLATDIEPITPAEHQVLGDTNPILDATMLGAAYATCERADKVLAREQSQLEEEVLKVGDRVRWSTQSGKYVPNTGTVVSVDVRRNDFMIVHPDEATPEYRLSIHVKDLELLVLNKSGKEPG